MLKLYAAFKDDPKRQSVVWEAETKAEALKRFNAAKKSRKIDEREVIGLWIIDQATGQGDVFDVWGNVPLDILARHPKQLKRRKR
jgi:hypothetical protein